MVFGRKKRDGADEADVDRVVAAAQARRAMWSKVGVVDDDVVAHLINPAFMGGPRWPALRQAFLKVTLPNGLAILATDGLSDPYDDVPEPNVGLGIEVFWVTPLGDVSVGDLPQHWQFGALYQLAQNLAARGSPVDALRTYGAMSMTISPSPPAPDDWYTDPGADLGVVFGMSAFTLPRKVKLSGGTVQLVAAAPLRPTELGAVVGPGGPDVRRGLAVTLEIMPLEQLASPARPAIL